MIFLSVPVHSLLCVIFCLVYTKPVYRSFLQYTCTQYQFNFNLQILFLSSFWELFEVLVSIKMIYFQWVPFMFNRWKLSGFWNKRWRLGNFGFPWRKWKVYCWIELITIPSHLIKYCEILKILKGTLGLESTASIVILTYLPRSLQMSKNGFSP